VAKIVRPVPLGASTQALSIEADQNGASRGAAPFAIRDDNL
jgi:hypothetical protein